MFLKPHKVKYYNFNSDNTRIAKLLTCSFSTELYSVNIMYLFTLNIIARAGHVSVC